MRGWLIGSKALDSSKNNLFNVLFLYLVGIFHRVLAPFSVLVHCGNCISYSVLCTRVVSVHEWQSSSKETWERYLDIKKHTISRWLFVRIERLSQIHDLPARHLGAWPTSSMNITFFVICRFKKFPGMKFRATICFLDQYYLSFALQGLHFWSLSQYSYQFLFEKNW